MFIQATKILGSPVGEIDSRSRIGKVKQIIVDLENGNLIALVVEKQGLFKKPKLLSVCDIIDFDKHAIVIRNEEDLTEIEEIVRAKKLIDKNIFIIGIKARTESGQELGKINDFVFDSEKLKITKFYLHSLFDERILSHDKVVKIDEDKREIVFSDDILKPTKSKKIKKPATQKAVV